MSKEEKEAEWKEDVLKDESEVADALMEVGEERKDGEKSGNETEMIENEWNRSLLIAAETGIALVVIECLQNPLCHVDCRNEDGRTSLILASWKGHKEVVDVLLAHNCNVDIQDTACGSTAVMFAAQGGHKDILDRLIEHNCNLDIQNSMGRVALFYAVWNYNKDIVATLLSHNCNVDIQDNRGWNAIILAGANGNMDLAELLIARNCNLDLQDEHGETALIAAAHYGHADIAALFINHKCNLELKNMHGETADRVATRYWHSGVYRVITKQIYRNRRWKRRKALMMVLVENRYLSSSTNAHIPPPTDPLRFEKVLGDAFLVRHIIRFV